MIGRTGEAPSYQAEMGFGGHGCRLDIDWMPATETPIVALTDRLAFTRNNRGMLARRVLFDLSDADSQTIRAAMTKD